MVLTDRWVLVHFFEEQLYDVLRLKDTIPASSVALNDASLATWDVETVVEAKWGPKTYPANLVQFGENKKEMEVVIDKLAEGMDIKEVPLIQPGVGGKEKIKKRPAVKTNNKIQLKKQKSINENMFKEVKQRILSAKAVQASTEVVEKHETPCSFEHETKVLQMTLLQKEAELLEKGNELACLQAKYNEQEENFANLKKKFDLLAPNDNVRLGDNLVIAPGKLALCRDKDPSKYVGDLLQVYYGQDILANACLKGVKKSNTKPHILDNKIIDDLVAHTVTKFGVPVGIVRQAIRQKLNTCHKRGKVEKFV